MQPLTRAHFKKILKMDKLTGPDKSCKYYPCHSVVEDCTWCFCPFYPCEDDSLGKYIRTKTGKEIWSCEKCNWIHRKDVAKEVLHELKILDIKKQEDIEKAHNKLLEIKDKIKSKYPP